MLTSLATAILPLATAISSPPPPPSFGCDVSEACLRVRVERALAASGKQQVTPACATALDAAVAFSTDYVWSGVDEGSGAPFFRARHDLHDPKFLYLAEPTSTYSPSLSAQWVLSRQHAKDFVIGDARSKPAALALHASDAPALQRAPPLGPSTRAQWQLPNAPSGCAVDVRVDCSLCSGVAAQSRTLEPRATQVGCTALTLRWAHPTPPFWGVGVAAPTQYKLRVEVPPIGTAPAVETVVPGAEAVASEDEEDASSTMLAGGGHADEDEDEDEDEDATEGGDLVNTARVDGLKAGTTYALRLAAALPSDGDAPATVVSRGWTSYGPPLLLTTATTGDTGGWPLDLEPATPAQVAAVSRVGQGASSRDASSSSNPGGDGGLLGRGDVCTQVHLLLPPASDCDGVRLSVEWRPPSDEDADGAMVDTADDDTLALRSHGADDGWQECLACSPVATAPIASDRGQRLLLASGLLPLGLYRFRLRLDVRDDLDIGETLTRLGPASGPLLAGWASPGPLAAPTVRAASYGSFLVKVPSDARTAACVAASGPIQWAVLVDGVPVATEEQPSVTVVRGDGSPAGGGGLGGGGEAASRGGGGRWVMVERRCPHSCAFQLRAANVLGADRHVGAATTAASLPLPPRLAPTADRLEVRVPREDATTIDSGGDGSSTAANLVTHLASRFADELGVALDAPDGARVVETRASLSFTYLVIELDPPSLTGILVRALKLRAMGVHCAPQAGGMLEWLRHERRASAACDALAAGAHTRAVDLSYGVFAEGGSRDAAARLAATASATVDHDHATGGDGVSTAAEKAAKHAWVQLAPELVQGEGVLTAHAAGSSSAAEVADQSAGDKVWGLLMVLLLLLALLGGPLLYVRVKERARGARRTASATDDTDDTDEHEMPGANDAGASAMCIACCDLVEERVLPSLPPTVRSWWSKRARPFLQAVSVTVFGKAEAASACAVDAARGWAGASRVRKSAPGSVGVPMLPPVDEEGEDDIEDDEEQGAAEERRLSRG